MAHLKSKPAAREILFQRIVFQMRIAIEDYTISGKLSPQSLSEMKKLMEGADNLGNHGAAFLDIDSKTFF